MSVPYQQSYKQFSLGNRDMPASIYFETHDNEVITLLMQKRSFLAIIRNEKDSALTIRETLSDGKHTSASMGIRFSAATLNIESYEHTLPGRTIVLAVDNSSGTPPMCIDMSDWKAKDISKTKLLLWKLNTSTICKIRIVVDDVTRFGKKWDDREVKWFLTRKITPYHLAPVVLPPPPAVEPSSPVATESETSVANTSMPTTSSAVDSSIPTTCSTTPIPFIAVTADPKPATLLASSRRALRVAKDTLADLQEDLQGEVVVNFKESFAKARAGIVGKEGEEDGIEERVLRYDMAQRKLFRVTALVQKEELYREVVVPGLEGRVKKWEDKLKEEEKAGEELIEF